MSDFAVGEITDAVSIDAALEGCDAVVHTAAMVSLDPADEERMRHTNLVGTFTLLEAARELVSECPCASGCPACIGPVLDPEQEAKSLTLALIEAAS